MSVWQAAQMILRYSEYADAIAALRTADRDNSEEEKNADAKSRTLPGAGTGAGDQHTEVKRKKRLLQMVATLGVSTKDSTLEHFIAVQDTLIDMKEVRLLLR